MANIASYIDKKKEEVEFYDDRARDLVEKTLKRGYGDHTDRLYWNLALDYIQRRGKAELEWAEDVIQQLSNFKPEDVGTSRAKKKGRG